MHGDKCVREAADEQRRRARGGASAPTRIPASGGKVQANKRPWKLPWVLGVMPSSLPDGVSGRTGVLTVAVAMAGGGALCTWGGSRVAFL
jgi:hypothetical protein